MSTTHARSIPARHLGWKLAQGNEPESALHEVIVHLLVEILCAWVVRAARVAQVGRNLAIRWNEQEPRIGVGPDVCVLEPPPPEGELVTSVCTWKPGHLPPRVAIEVVSESTAMKDYRDGPERHSVCGVRELWVFDPLRLGPAWRGGPHVLQLWRRDTRGRLRRAYAGNGPVRSVEMDAWVVVTNDGMRLRIANDPDGKDLWLTGMEQERAARMAQRAAWEEESAAEESQSASLEQERTARQASEAENERLRAELARLRGK